MDLGAGGRLMSGLTSITDAFGDGVHTFKLPFAQLEELQERTGVGPAALLGRLADGTWRVADVRETVRLALIGGGEMTAADALRFVSRYVDGEPLNDSLAAAVSILAITLNGRPRPTPASPVGEQGAAKPETGPDGSTSPLSDAPLPSSASAPPS